MTLSIGLNVLFRYAKSFWKYLKNCLGEKMHDPIFALPKTNAALVKGLRRLPFTEESRVRIPYVVQSPAKLQGFSFVPTFYQYTKPALVKTRQFFRCRLYCKARKKSGKFHDLLFFYLHFFW